MRKTFEIPLDIPDVTIQTVETDRHGDFVITVFHVWRDKLSSIAYSEKLNSFTISATLQSTDRRYGNVGQKSADFQLDSRKR